MLAILFNLMTCGCLQAVPVTYIVDGVDDGVARIESPAGNTITLPAAWFPLAVEGGRVEVIHVIFE